MPFPVTGIERKLLAIAAVLVVLGLIGELFLAG